MNNASHNAVNRPVRPGFSWGGAVAVLSLAFVAALGAPASAAMVDDVDFCLSVGKWGPYGPNGPGPNPYDSIAFVDLASWKVVTDTGGVQPITVLGPEPLPWVPVAGDFDGDGFDSILMFNTQDWSLVDAEKGPIAPREGAADPQPNPWRPVAGDFDGDGRDSVLIYDLRNGATYRPEAGPLTVERYDPAPEPWIVVAGDWDGDGIDTIGTIRFTDSLEPQPVPWIPVAGDFDGDGIDTVAAFHGPSGKLAEAAEAKSLDAAAAKVSSRNRTAAAAEKGLFTLPNGCYLSYKKKKDLSALLQDGTGGQYLEEHALWEQWFCCPAAPGSRLYSCSVITFIS